MTNALPQDTNGIVYEGIRDPAGQQFVAKSAGSVYTDAAGVKSAPQMVTPTTTAKAGYVSLNAPPVQTTANVDTSLTFASQVNHWLLQNNTGGSLYFELDAVASAGSILLTAGSAFISDIPVTALHLYTTTAQNINGTAAGNIVLRGWL